MVKEITKKEKKYFQCEECRMFYLKNEIAEKCENWCRKYSSCNLEIIKNAVKT
mgnify:CR=1 FL=1